MAIVLPPNEIFETSPKPLEDLVGGQVLNSFVGLTKDEKGRILAESSNSLLPRRGLAYPSAARNNNIMKSILMFFLSSTFTFRPTVKWLDKTLGNFYILAYRIYMSEAPKDGKTCKSCSQSIEGKLIRSDFMHYSYYNPQSQGIWTFLSKFLTELGCSIINANNIGKVIATVIEYEEPYRWRLGDLFGEINKETLIKNPRKEINRIISIYEIREKMNNIYNGGNGIDRVVSIKFVRSFKLLSYLLFVPKIKKAFIYASKNTDFQEMKLDKYDIYHALLYPSYDFFGQSEEVRKNWFIEFCESQGVKVIIN
jgi:hypothetical protein